MPSTTSGSARSTDETTPVGITISYDREQMKSKSDAELETIIDAYSKTADSSYRRAAIEEKHDRLKKQNKHSDNIQKSILIISIAVLILTAIGVLIGYLTLAKQP